MHLHGIDILSAGAAPLIAAYCREIRLAEIVNNIVRWDSKQWNVTPGDLLVAMVINLLVDRAPLYRIRNFYVNRDLDLLFGQGRMTLEALNDRHFGTLLDRLYEAGPELVYHSITASAITTHNIDIKQLHADTTSKAVQGAYEQGEGLNITWGHSKDKRPDLKQFLYGLIVADGVPVAGKVMDGNTSDKTWNKEIIKELAAILSPRIAQEVLYIADSAFVTEETLAKVNQQQVKFISRLPGTFKLVDELKEQALAQDNWVQVGSFSDSKKAAKYRVWESRAQLYSQEYRFIVVHSSALEATKARTIERKIQKEEKELAQKCKALAKRAFACEADAIAELAAFQKEHRDAYHKLNGQIICKEEKKKRQGRGRPPAGYTPEYEIKWYVECSVGAVKPEAVQKALAREAMFILITNVLDSSSLSAAEALQKYKEQNSVEIRFRWLKDPTTVKQIWLDTPSRVMALGFVFLIGLLVYCLLERRIRKNLAQESKPIRLHGNRLTKKPTAAAFLQLFNDIVTVRCINEDGSTTRGLPPRYNTEELKRALRLAGFDSSIYSKIPYSGS